MCMGFFAVELRSYPNQVRPPPTTPINLGLSGRYSTAFVVLFCAGERVRLDVGEPVLVQSEYFQRAHAFKGVRVNGADLVVVQVKYQQTVQTLQRRCRHAAQRVLRQV